MTALVLLVATTVFGAQDATPRDPRDPARGFITFAVNVHDWRFIGDSADAVLFPDAPRPPAFPPAGRPPGSP